jgi:hypothetical protein
MDPVHERSRPGFIGMHDCIHSRSFHGCDLPTSVSLNFPTDCDGSALWRVTVLQVSVAGAGSNDRCYCLPSLLIPILRLSISLNCGTAAERAVFASGRCAAVGVSAAVLGPAHG